MKSKKTFITILVFAAVSWIVFFVLVWRFDATTNLITELAQEELIESRKEASISLIQKTLEDSAEDREKINSYLVTEDTVVDFIQVVESLGRDAGVGLDVNLVSFEEVSVGEDPKAEKVETKLLIQMVSNGNWQNTFQFIALLENLPYKISFQKLGLILQEIQIEGEEGTIREWRGDYEIHVVTNK